MSSRVLEYTQDGQVGDTASNSDTPISFNALAEKTGQMVGLRPLTGLDKRHSDLPRERVLRRIHGVLLEIAGEDARVILKEDNMQFEYYLPANPLRGAGINIPGQPFEMDEFEQCGKGEYSVGYRYRPAALEKDAYIEALDLDNERRHKLEAIRDGWKDSQD